MERKKRTLNALEAARKSTPDYLYVQMQDPQTRRKHLLFAMKNALIMQEEVERVLEIRTGKKQVLQAIKKGLDQLNSEYQSLKKVLPNVKSVLSFTEKELQHLDSHVDILKDSISSDEKRIEIDEELEQSIKGEKKQVVKEQSKAPKKRSSPVSRIDRIKNNLSLIEGKLKDL